MEHIVECVPNFSEGKDKGKIDAITTEIDKVDGVKLLNVEMDESYNRTVVTFVGEPERIADAAFQATRKAAEVIDMTTHKGEHPRMGATDVVPFIPVAGVSMDDCVEISKTYGKRVGEELDIPVYLYEFSATRPERKNLAKVRKGEYEGLSEKLADPEWTPDFGAPSMNERSGATITGARKFLIAYNVNVDSTDVSISKRIAEEIRESGKIMRDEDGNKVMDPETGKAKRIPGRLKAVKGMGVSLEQHGITQVSMNLVDYETTPIHVAFEECKKEAEKLGSRVTGSEIVGLVPKESLLQAGRFYAEADGKEGLEEMALIELAIERLGLSQLDAFDPKMKIIEYMI